MTEYDRMKEQAAMMEGLVEHWFFETFHGSLVARSTEVWNAVHDAKEDLKRRLLAHLAQEVGDTAPKD